MNVFLKFSKSADFKIYLVIIFASVTVLFMGVNLYQATKDQMISLSDKNKIATTQNIVKSFDTWLHERIQALSTVSLIMQNLELADDDERLSNILNTFYNNSSNFDAVQFLKDNGDIFVNGERYVGDDTQFKQRMSLVWFLETKQTNSSTINFIAKHTVLNTEVLNICVPSHKNGEFTGVLCGVVKISNIFKNIRNLKLSPNSYYFIVTHSGEILTQMSDINLKEQIQSRFKEMFLASENLPGISINSNFISLAEIPSLNWFVGAGAYDERQVSELLAIFQNSAVFVFISFLILILLANSLHNFMYKKIKDKNDEYEILLAHKTKMSEAGELISGINHQFIQPVNSLKIMITTLQMLEKDGNLDKQTLNEILKGGESSVCLLSDTIEIFRNFYKTSENINKFSVAKSVKNLLMLMHTELSRVNVKVVLVNSSDVIVTQKDNIIQQILLILIHNAKDAVVEKFENINKREIAIDIKSNDAKCFIAVSEYGWGVSEAMRDKIFSMPKTTKKSGNGIGLYFGKKLANEKIGGDLKLVSDVNPTVFELSFDINLKGKK